MAEVGSIEQLRIYKTALALENEVFELVKHFPADQFYGLANDLRRASSAVCHHIQGAHNLYSYKLKIDELRATIREAEVAQKYLGDARPYGADDRMISEYTSVIKQSWGLIKWFRAKLEERNEKAEVAAKEEMANTAPIVPVL